MPNQQHPLIRGRRRQSSSSYMRDQIPEAQPKQTLSTQPASPNPITPTTSSKPLPEQHPPPKNQLICAQILPPDDEI